MQALWLLVSLLGLGPAPAAQPAHAAHVADVAVLVLSPPPGPAYFGDSREEMVQWTRQLLAALHEAGRLRYRPSSLAPEDFERCLAMGRSDWQETVRGKGREACIARLLPATDSGAHQVAVLVEQMMWRSAAQGVTCISGAGIGRGSVHLAEIEHALSAAREGLRGSMLDCIEEALGRE